MPVHGAQLPRAAHAAPAAHDRSSAQVADDTGPAAGGLVQPGLPRRPAEGGRERAAAREARERARRRRRSGSPSTRSRGRATTVWAATRPASCRCIRRPRACRPAASASSRGACAALERHAVEPLPARLRAARAPARPRRRARGGALARVARGGAGRPPPARLRGAVPVPARARETPPHAPGGARGGAARARPARWCERWLDVAAVRAHRRASARRCEEIDARPRQRAGRCSGC